ncbi:unnamed protein product [Aphanomyces euteiches]|uniref:FYVE-type domain-containing protein n=1 Tax=Aphanomyces euteiches TaxID=100861 RepID=A0A6G0X7X2_9STRA|nr:hypothetical protein Ae201684_007191 [Aphanomyces euteiches]KAH9100855.1 hypothetical protein Ae201684P_007047 [Aphanomyces euteiches]KAH9153611.1 hypothetical protein AeRB84_004164 [Aphanomyces euteiches]
MVARKSLPTCFLRRPALTPLQNKQLQAAALASADRLIKKAQLQNGTVQWSLSTQEANFKVFRGTHPTAPQTSTLHCGTVDLMGTLDEFIDLFSPQEFADGNFTRFNRLLNDHVSLYTVVEPEANQPRRMVNVVWQVYDSPTANLVQNQKRDACVLECQREMYSRGQRIWVYSLESIGMDCCPDLQPSLGYIRIQNHGSGFVVREMAAGYLQVTFINHVDQNVGGSEWMYNNAKQWFTDVAMKRQTKALLDLQVFMRENRLSRTPFIATFHMTSKSSVRACFLCAKRFGPLARKINCQKCGEVLCSGCIHVWNVRVRQVQTKANVCAQCSMGDPVQATSPVKSTKSLPSASAVLSSSSQRELESFLKTSHEPYSLHRHEPTPETSNDDVLSTVTSGFDEQLTVGFDEQLSVFDLRAQLENDNDGFDDDNESDVLSTATTSLFDVNKPLFDLRQRHNDFDDSLSSVMMTNTNSKVFATQSTVSMFDEEQALDSIFADREAMASSVPIVVLSDRSMALTNTTTTLTDQFLMTSTSSLFDEAAYLSQVFNKSKPASSSAMASNRDEHRKASSNSAASVLDGVRREQQQQPQTRSRSMKPRPFGDASPTNSTRKVMLTRLMEQQPHGPPPTKHGIVLKSKGSGN